MTFPLHSALDNLYLQLVTANCYCFIQLEKSFIFQRKKT